MFGGAHETAVDKKGRVGLVSRYSEHFTNEVTVLKWENHLRVFRPEQFEKLAGYVDERLSFNSSKGLKAFFLEKNQKDRRHFFGNKFDLNFDAQKRLTIPKTLRDGLDLYSDVVWVGCGEYMELWAKKHYDADCAQWEQAGGFENLFAEPPAPTTPIAPTDSPGSDGDGRDDG